MNYIVDTNILSELLRPKPNQDVVDWLLENEGNLYTTPVTINELYFGVMIMSEGPIQRPKA